MPEPNRFLRHILTMVTGAALAQAIPLLVSPLLTRLYTPADFGVLSAVVAAAGILSVVSTLRYELAIILPKDEAGAANLAAIALSVMIVLCITTTVLIAGFPDIAQHVLSRASNYAVVVPLLTALLSFSQLLSTTANRQREYVTIARGSVLQQIVASLVSIGAGILALPVNGLIIGRLSGYAITCVYYVRRLASILERWIGLVEKPKLFEEAVTYCQFPFFNVPYSLIGSVSREFLILAFTAMHQAEAAGYYGLARSVLTAPIGFLSTSLSQVFYKEAAVSIGTPEFKRLTLNILRYLGAGLMPFFVLGWFWAPDVFQVLFGARWREAGNFAALLVPIGCLSLFTSWPERVFEVRRKQHWSLSIQLAFDSITVGLVTWALAQSATPLTAIKVYVAIQCFYHLTYLAAIFKLSDFSSKDFRKFVCFGAALVGLIWIMDDLIIQGATTLWLQFGISVLAAVVSSLLLLLLAHRSAKSDVRKRA
jgi:O-antigen/teichoic acid export membrane protein